MTQEQLNFKFTKAEKLCSKKIIESVIASGKSINQYPFKIVFLQQTLSSPYPIQIVFSVPKRNFKLAVSRNKIKRQLREIYRLQFQNLKSHLSNKQMQLAMVLIYIAKESLSYQDLEKSMSKLQNKLLAQI